MQKYCAVGTETRQVAYLRHANGLWYWFSTDLQRLTALLKSISSCSLAVRNCTASEQKVFAFGTAGQIPEPSHTEKRPTELIFFTMIIN